MGRSLDLDLEREIELRFYEELNDFLPRERRKRSFRHRFRGTPAVKDVVEALGAPHTEIDVILVDGESVGFGHRLTGGERVAVYPTFERFDVSDFTRLRPVPLRETRFIADVHLGKLARYLRLLGFDTIYERELEDAGIASLSRDERRIVLTRDRGLLKRKSVTRGHLVRASKADVQLTEVIESFDLRKRIAPFTRCLACNGPVRPVERELVEGALPEYTRMAYERFRRCESCQKVYWAGAHFARLQSLVDAVAGER
jgi:uncharacterized protein